MNSIYNRLTTFIFLSLLVFSVRAQPGCPSVDAGPDVSLTCGIACADLAATPFKTGGTNAYEVSQIPYTPFPYNTGTPILVNIDDTWSQAIPLPFNFCFFGNIYTKIILASNCIVSFDTSSAGQYSNYVINDSIPTPNNINGAFGNSIMGPWQDTDPSFQGNTYYQIIGTAPCRIFIASWYRIPYFGDPNSKAAGQFCNSPIYATSQIVLYETTNAIEIYIENKEVCPNWNDGAAIEGIVGDNGATAYTVPGRNYHSGSSWTAQNDAWRFNPNGVPSYTTRWFEGTTLVGTGDSIQVCPTTLQTTYTAITTYEPCGVGTPIVVADSLVVNLSGIFSVNIDSSKNISCNSANDGVAWVSIIGGSQPVNYGWSNGQNNLVIAGLSAGTYIFTASDATGCLLADTVSISNPPALLVNLVNQNNGVCSSVPQGSLTVSGAGGTPGYTYRWSNNQNGPNIIGLGAGIYTVTITDTTLCTATASYTIVPDASMVANPIVGDVSCYLSSDGSIDVNPSNGVPPYTFVWNVSKNTQVANGLAAGNYRCTVTDVNGCTASINENITEPSDIQITVSATAVKCVGNSDGVILVSATGGSAPYSFAATLDFSIWHYPKDGFSGEIEELSEGVFTVAVADDNGCIKRVQVTVPNAQLDQFIVYSDSTSCYGPDYNDGVVYVDVVSTQNGPYQFSIDSGEFQFATEFYDLAAGLHTITAVNTNNCPTNMPVLVYEPLPIIADMNPDSIVIELGGSELVQVNYLNANNPSFNWTPSFGLSCIDCANPSVTPYENEDYTVTISVEKVRATCYGYATLHVTVLPPKPIYIPNSFTPNGDGNNDVFLIYGVGIKTVDMKVFNRWGEKVFESDNQFYGWDGFYKSEVQSPGVYTYTAKISYLDDSETEKLGSVTLLK
ncbi:MAG: gliding motility-associated C-terminal domain-containing protein [Bacteroidetes bacterium]|nr:gliding motility-associated C-terminal domain-containing protein [Bacteroidota bacterium]